MKPAQFPPKFCLTASGVLVYEQKVLLIKHKKLGFWLAPGGHIDEDESPDQAAVREFWEETGLRVKAISAGKVLPKIGNSSYYPLPFAINLHWISQENYQARLASNEPSCRHSSNKWPKGCEQHLNFSFLVKPLADLNFKQNTEETDGISWFSWSELADLELVPQMKQEIKCAFELAAN